MESTRRLGASLVTGATAFMALLAGFDPAHAQSAWLDRSERSTFHLEFARPLFDGGSEFGFGNGAGYLSTRLALGPRLFLVAEVPFAVSDRTQDVPYEQNESTFGNPYVGIESKPGGLSGMWLEFGLRATATFNAPYAEAFGIAADIDRWEAYGGPDVIFMQFGVHWRRQPEDGVGIDARISPRLWIAESFADASLFNTLGVQVLRRTPTVRAGLGWTGRIYVSASGNFSQNTTHQLEAVADFLPGAWRPGATLRVPLDNDSGVDAVIGATLTFVP